MTTPNGTTSSENSAVLLSEVIAERDRLAALVRFAPDAIFVSDHEGRYIEVNEPGCRLLGLSYNDILGKTVFDFVAPDQISLTQQLLRDIDSNGSTIFEWLLRRTDDTEIPIEVHSSLLPNGQRQSIVRELNQRKRAEAEFRRMAAIIRDSNDAITLQDLDGTILAWNQGAERLYGFSADEALGKNISIIVPKGDEDSLDNSGIVAPGQHGVSREVRRCTKNGKILDVWLTTTQLFENDKPIAIATTERDLTERNRREREQRFELDCLKRLHEVSSCFWHDKKDDELFAAILDAAIAICEADFGNIQVVDIDTGNLVVVAHRGLPARWLEYWRTVSMGRGVCGKAYENKARVIVEDVISSPMFSNEKVLQIQLDAGIRAVQSTPLLSHSGEVIGMISTYYHVARCPSERSLQFLDLLARQTANMLERRRIENALRRSEAKAAGILATCADAVVSIDSALRIIAWNEGASHTFGYSTTEILGEGLDALIPLSLRAQHRDYVAHFIAEGAHGRKMDHQRAVGVRKNGEEFPIHVTISKLLVDGQMVLSAIVRDISEEKRSRIEEKLLAELGNALGTLADENALQSVARALVAEFTEYAIIFVADEEERLQCIATAARTTADDLIVKRMMSASFSFPAIHPIPRAFGERRAIVSTIDPAQYEHRAAAPEHLESLQLLNPRHVLATPLLIAGKPIGVFALASRARAYDERDLRLADEVGRRLALFLENDRSYRAKKRALQMRDEVLGVVAHDLRNPLHTIMFQCGILRHQDAGLERKPRNPVDAIERAVARMNSIIEDLLLATQLEAGSLGLECAKIAPDKLVDDIVEVQRPQAFSRSIELRQDVAENLPEIWADRERLERVFENLIGNAIKFTRKGTITVTAKFDGAEVIFGVLDTGVGIASDELPHLFDRFWQGGNRQRSGVGLGLSIVKGIVAAHGGKVWAESKIGIGAAFFFTIPIAR